MITIGEEIVIKDLAEKLGINVSDIIKKFFMEGKLLTANAILSFEEAEEVALEIEPAKSEVTTREVPSAPRPESQEQADPPAESPDPSQD